MTQTRSVACFLTCAAALIASGCEDSAAFERDQVQRHIAEASRELKLALAGASGVGEGQSEQKLSAALTKLNGVSGGEPGQQAAKALLAASGFHQLAMIHLDRADAIESEHRAARVALDAKVDSVVRLHALAEARASTDLIPHIDALKEGIEQSRTRIEELQTKIAELDGPINERVTQNHEAQEDVNQLRIQVGELLRKARDMGASAGLSTFHQATDLRRQADKIEFDIANAEIELDYSLTPEHAMASTQSEQLNGLIAALEAMSEHLSAASNANAAQVETTRQAVNAAAQEISAALGEMETQTSGPLKEAYDAALSSLDNAATQAEAAARNLNGAESQSARMLLARIRESQGSAHWAAARAAADQEALLKRLVDQGGELGSQFGPSLSAAQTARKDATAKAQEAFAAAQEALQQVQSNSDPETLVRLQQNLDASIAALQGKAAAAPADTETHEASAQGDASAGTAQSDGFESPEALIEHVQSLANQPFVQQIEPMLAITHVSTPEAKQAMDAARAIGQAMTELHAAMSEKFGAEQSTAAITALGGAGSAPEISADQISERSETAAVIDYTHPMLGPKKLHLIAVDGRWHVNGDEMDAQERQVMTMMAPLAPAMKAASADVAARIRAGEFESAEAALQAFQQAMMPGMGGSPAGG